MNTEQTSKNIFMYNSKSSMKFFQVPFNIWVTQYWIIFGLSSVICSFNLANIFSFHGLKFEVLYLVLSVIASIHVSRAVTINALERFIVRGSI